MLVLLLFLGGLILPHAAKALCVDYSNYIRWETSFQATIGGNIEDILIVGDYAYLAYSSTLSGGRLCVVDISDPGDPQEVTLIPTSDKAYGLDYVAPYLYVICQDGLTIYDATVVSNPIQVGYLAMAGDPEAVSIRWPIGIVVGHNPELSMLNIATPTNPILATTLDWPNGQAEDVRVVEDLAYVADSNHGLAIVDFSNFPDLVVRSGVDLPGGGHGIRLRGSYAWVMGQDAVTVINISNPDVPTISNSTAVPGLAVDICFATLMGMPPETYAAVAMEEGTTLVFDSTNAGILQPVCSVPGPYGVKCIASDAEGYSWNYLYVGSEIQGLYVVNRGNLANPPVVGTIDVDAVQVLVSGSIAYLATTTNIQTFDVSSVGSPQMLGSVPTASPVTDMVLHTPYLITTQGNSGLKIYDVSSPESLVLLGSEQNPYYGGALDVSWPYVYVVPAVTFEGGSLRVYEISDPTNPIMIGILSSGWDWYLPARDVVVQGSYAYVTGEGEVYLRIVDISNPADPDLVNIVPANGYAHSIVVDDGLAYISRYTGRMRLETYDLSDPLSPVIVSDFVVPVFSQEAKVLEEYLFLLTDSGWPGMFIFDVSNPANPQPVGIAATQARDIFVNGSNIFIANYDELLIMPTQCGIVSSVETMPTVTSTTLTAYPNPFNPRTTFYYELPVAAQVNLAVYDMSGRLVRKLMSGQQHSPGHFEIVWSGTDELGRVAPSGIYVCRMEAGDYRATTRVTLLK